MPTDIKYGNGYVILNYEDGSTVRVEIERKTSVAGPWKPFPIKDVAKLAEALQ